MCSRYATVFVEGELLSHLELEFEDKYVFQMHYNVAPTHQVPLIKENRITSARWGITPWWQLPNKLLFITIENLLTKPTFGDLIDKGRCAMLCSGFFEWRDAVDGKKVPVYFSSPQHPILAFAGLIKDGECSLITTTPNQTVGRVHTRMPCLLTPATITNWIDGCNLDEIVDPFPDDLIVSWDVTTRMSNPRYDGQDTIEPCPYVPIQGSLFG